MRKTALVLAILIVLALPTGGFAFQNEPDGFRGLKWGDPPREDMEYIGDAYGKGYTLSDDKMKIGNVDLRRIVYNFYENRFFIVAIYFVFENNYDLLKIICEERYGRETLDGYYNLRWISQKSFVALTYDPGKEKGILTLGNTVIMSKKLEAEKKKEAEKAEEDW